MAGTRSISLTDDRGLRRRLGRVMLTYLAAVLVSALVVRAGASALSVGGGAMAGPWMIIGSGGVLGAGAIAAAAGYARGAIRGGSVDRARLGRAALPSRLGRLLMLTVAVGAAVVSVALAPSGGDRGLAIAVNTGLAGLLALFALLANDVTRAIAAVPATAVSMPESEGT